ncbi:MAG TPA: sensor histidine kinase [Deinococcales bacterium]|nr:sensor histidine kinase [Deinococcales bacterium]
MNAVAAMTGGINWFGAFWLVFLLQPLLGFAQRTRAPLEWVGFLAVLAGFVVVYFWVLADRAQPDGRRGHRALAGVAVAFAYALLLSGATSNASAAFLVYAAAFAGYQSRRWVTVATVLVAAAATLALHFMAGLDWASVITVSFLALAVGVGNTYLLGWRSATVRLQETQLEVARVARVAERERIGRDLHDLLGHTLSVIVLKSELAAKLATANPERAAQEMRDVERIGREALTEVRQTVRGYRSSGLQAELAGAVTALEAAGVQLNLDLHTGPMDPEAEQALALVLREAITNVIRHARARACGIGLEVTPETATLTVTDDGGAPPALVEGNGLRNMRRRVTDLGGDFDLRTGRGLSLTARVPASRPATPRPPEDAAVGA